MVALAAASETASPPAVPEKNRPSMTFMCAALPTRAASGKPLPMALTTQARKGVSKGRCFGLEQLLEGPEVVVVEGLRPLPHGLGPLDRAGSGADEPVLPA